MAVNDEESSEAESLVLLQNPVGSADGHVLVGQQGDLHLAQSALFAILKSKNILEDFELFPARSDLLAPGQVGEVGVGGAGHDGAVEGLELGGPVGEGDDLGGADEGEVQRVEEEDHVLPLRDAVSQRQDDQVEISPL